MGSVQSRNRFWLHLGQGGDERHQGAHWKPHHASCFWFCFFSECHGGKGRQEGPGPHRFLPQLAQLPHLRPWQMLHCTLWTRRLWICSTARGRGMLSITGASMGNVSGSSPSLFEPFLSVTAMYWCLLYITIASCNGYNGKGQGAITRCTAVLDMQYLACHPL